MDPNSKKPIRSKKQLYRELSSIYFLPAITSSAISISSLLRLQNESFSCFAQTQILQKYRTKKGNPKFLNIDEVHKIFAYEFKTITKKDLFFFYPANAEWYSVCSAVAMPKLHKEIFHPDREQEIAHLLLPPVERRCFPAYSRKLFGFNNRQMANEAQEAEINANAIEVANRKEAILNIKKKKPIAYRQISKLQVKALQLLRSTVSLEKAKELLSKRFKSKKKQFNEEIDVLFEDEEERAFLKDVLGQNMVYDFLEVPVSFSGESNDFNQLFDLLKEKEKSGIPEDVLINFHRLCEAGYFENALEIFFKYHGLDFFEVAIRPIDLLLKNVFTHDNFSAERRLLVYKDIASVIMKNALISPMHLGVFSFIQHQFSLPEFLGMFHDSLPALPPFQDYSSKLTFLSKHGGILLAQNFTFAMFSIYLNDKRTYLFDSICPSIHEVYTKYVSIHRSNENMKKYDVPAKQVFLLTMRIFAYKTLQEETRVLEFASIAQTTIRKRTKAAAIWENNLIQLGFYCDMMVFFCPCSKILKNTSPKIMISYIQCLIDIVIQTFVSRASRPAFFSLIANFLEYEGDVNEQMINNFRNLMEGCISGAIEAFKDLHEIAVDAQWSSIIQGGHISLPRKSLYFADYAQYTNFKQDSSTSDTPVALMFL